MKVKKKIRDGINRGYKDPRIQLMPYFDPRFKVTFVAMGKEVKDELL